MKRFGVICLTTLCLSAFTGCMFFKKSAKTESPTSVAEMERAFKQRWVEKRTAELSAQGLSPTAARAQATEEFRARYGFTSAAQP